MLHYSTIALPAKVGHAWTPATKSRWLRRILSWECISCGAKLYALEADDGCCREGLRKHNAEVIGTAIEQLAHRMLDGDRHVSQAPWGNVKIQIDYDPTYCVDRVVATCNETAV